MRPKVVKDTHVLSRFSRRSYIASRKRLHPEGTVAFMSVVIVQWVWGDIAVIDPKTRSRAVQARQSSVRISDVNILDPEAVIFMA